MLALFDMSTDLVQAWALAIIAAYFTLKMLREFKIIK